MSEEAENLRRLLQPYLVDNANMNGEIYRKHAEANQERVARGNIPITTPPRHIPPSFDDLMYWVQQAGHYAKEEQS